MPSSIRLSGFSHSDLWFTLMCDANISRSGEPETRLHCGKTSTGKGEAPSHCAKEATSCAPHANIPLRGILRCTIGLQHERGQAVV